MYDSAMNIAYSSDKKSGDLASIAMEHGIEPSEGNKLSPRPVHFEGSMLTKEIKELLNPPKNPLLKYAKLSFVGNKGLYEEQSLKECLKTMPFAPEHVLFLIKKRVEYTFDKYPLLTEDNKQSQKTIKDALGEFCNKFKLDMIKVPKE